MEEQFDRLAEDLLADPQVSRSKMMGHFSVKLGKKAFAMGFGDDIVVKLGVDRVQAMIGAGEARPFDPGGMGRPMKEWAQVPPSTLVRWGELADEAKEFVRAAGAY